MCSFGHGVEGELLSYKLHSCHCCKSHFGIPSCGIRMQYRISAIAAIYDKSLRLKSTSNVEQLSSSRRQKATKSSKTAATSGKVVNIATNDVERFLLATLFASHIFWAPVQSVAILITGWFVIGWAFAAGFGLLIFFFVPMQFYLSKKFAMLRGKIAHITDDRVTQVSQAVSGKLTFHLYFKSNYILPCFQTI